MTNPVRHLNWPLSDEERLSLRAGEHVTLSGTCYTARDAAHARLIDHMKAGIEPPFPLTGALIYYVGPTPARPGQVIGSAGPTSAYRMDSYTPTLLAAGLRGIIGKGHRGQAVIQSICDHGAVYFAALGGLGPVLAQSITASQLIAYEDLGTEAIRQLTLDHFPAIVAVDSQGNNVYETGPAAYLAERGSH